MGAERNYSVIQKYGLNFVSLYFKIRTSDKYDMAWTVNGASKHARQLVAVFQVLCSLYRLTCVAYAQNSLEIISRSPLIHAVGRSFCLYTDSLFAQVGDSKEKCSSSLEVECWKEEEMHRARQSATQINELTNAENLVLHSSHFALNWRCCTAVR